MNHNKSNKKTSLPVGILVEIPGISTFSELHLFFLSLLLSSRLNFGFVWPPSGTNADSGNFHAGVTSVFGSLGADTSADGSGLSEKRLRFGAADILNSKNGITKYFYYFSSPDTRKSCRCSKIKEIPWIKISFFLFHQSLELIHRNIFSFRHWIHFLWRQKVRVTRSYHNHTQPNHQFEVSIQFWNPVSYDNDYGFLDLDPKWN